jgi:bifunctional non-homologous end joining protein LigD
MSKEKTVELHFKEGGSDKVYIVSLKEKNGGYVVEIAYGRVGNSLTTGTKTPQPVSEEAALKVYNKLVNEKTSKGYKELNSDGAMVSADHIELRDTGFRPQLLNEVDEDEVGKYLKDDNWCAQEKFDGRRRAIIVSKEGIVATNRKGLSVACSPKITKTFEDSFDPSFVSFPTTVFDGEDMGDYIMLFDMVNVMGYKERYELLSRMDWIGPDYAVQVVRTAWTTKEKKDLYKTLKSRGAEGIVFKRIDSMYTPGRPNSGGDQLKFKFCETASCIVIEHNTTKRSVKVGAYDNGKLIPIGNVTIYPNQEIPEEGAIVEVKYLYYFTGGSLFQPVYIGERDDIDAGTCTLKKLKVKTGSINDESDS